MMLQLPAQQQQAKMSSELLIYQKPLFGMGQKILWKTPSLKSTAKSLFSMQFQMIRLILQHILT